MASKTASPYAVLFLRLVTLALLAASLAIIATDKLNLSIDIFLGIDGPRKLTFKDVYAYRYVLAVAVIGCAYTLLQIPFAAVSIVRRKRLVGGGSEGVALFLTFSDVVAALLLATGAAAVIGLSYDAKRYADLAFHEWQEWFDQVQVQAPPEFGQTHHSVNRFLAMAFASAGLMLGAAACVAITIIVCVYSLVK